MQSPPQPLPSPNLQPWDNSLLVKGVVVWIEKHAVDKISVIVYVREFEIVGSRVRIASYRLTGFSSSRYIEGGGEDAMDYI